jgi:hypothetical protein
MSVQSLMEIVQMNNVQLMRLLLGIQKVVNATGYGKVVIIIENGKLKFVEETIRDELPKV